MDLYSECKCGGIGRVSSIVAGAWLIEPCSCNNGDWATTRKPELEQILREAEERAHGFNGGMEKMA